MACDRLLPERKPGPAATPFLRDALSILEAAESAASTGQGPSELSILIAPGGGIHIFANSDWPLDRLKDHHGAASAYQVTSRDRKLTLLGIAGPRRCVLQTDLSPIAPRPPDCRIPLLAPQLCQTQPHPGLS
jgi:hypothetical protein